MERTGWGWVARHWPIGMSLLGLILMFSVIFTTSPNWITVPLVTVGFAGVFVGIALDNGHG